MSKLTYKVSYYVLYALLAVIAIVLVLFYFGGSATGDDVIASINPDMWQPAQTDALLYLMYTLFFVTVIAAVGAAVLQFGSALKDNPSNALKSLLGVALLILVLFISWAMGDDTPLEITGYTGPDNVPFWLKITDMFLYSTYALLIITLLAILVSSIKKRLS